MVEKIEWQTLKEYEEILYQFHDGIAKISINRPEVHNAFTPLTVMEMSEAMELSRQDPRVGVIILTGEGGAFCAGADISEFSEVRATVEDGRAYEAAGDLCQTAISSCSKATSR